MEVETIAYGQDLNAVRFMNEAQTEYMTFLPSAAVGIYYVIEEGQGLETRMREIHVNEIGDEYHPKIEDEVHEKTEGWNLN